jgi:hypothetical protein
VSRIVYKTDAGRSGFIRSTLAPIDSKREARFGLFDIVLFMGSVVGVLAIMRLLLAH